MSKSVRNDNKVFQVYGDDVTLKEVAACIPEFQKLLKVGDSSVNKLLAYIYHFCDANSPYYNLPEGEKKAILLEDLELTEEIVSHRFVQEAIDKFVYLNDTVSSRFLKAVERSIDTLADFLENSTEKDIKLILDTINKGSSLLTSYQTLVDQVKKEKASTATIRGNAAKSILFS